MPEHLSEAKKEKKRLRDIERKKRKAEELGLDPDAKRLELEMPLPPKLEEESPEEYTSSIRLTSALYEACEELKDAPKCTVSMLGSHYRVHAVKKGDARLKQYRLVEMIKRHPDIFEVTELEQEGQSAQWPVKIIDGAKEILSALQKKAGVMSLEEEEAQDGLPEFEIPTDQQSALQAVRLAGVRALKRRGHSTPLQDMCQDRQLIKLKNCFKGDKVVEKILAYFEDNFQIDDRGHGLKEVTLLSADIDNTDMLEELAEQTGKEHPQFVGEDNREKGREEGDGPPRRTKGKGKGKESMMWEALAAKGFQSFLYMAGMGKGWGKGKGKGKMW